MMISSDKAFWLDHGQNQGSEEGCTTLLDQETVHITLFIISRCKIIKSQSQAVCRISTVYLFHHLQLEGYHYHESSSLSCWWCFWPWIVAIKSHLLYHTMKITTCCISYFQANSSCVCIRCFLTKVLHDTNETFVLKSYAHNFRRSSDISQPSIAW